MSETKVEVTCPEARQMDRVYVCKHPAQMENPSARATGFVIRVSGAICDIVTFSAGGSRAWLGCRHIDDPGGRRQTLFEDTHYGLWRLADPEQEAVQAFRQSKEAIAACSELAATLVQKRRGRPPKESLEDAHVA